MAEPRKPNELDAPSETAGPRNVNAPDPGGSFEELDESLRAAREAEQNSSAGS